VSISSVSIEFARKIFDGFQGRTVLLVGAGKMGDLAARSLHAHGAEVIVTNRTLSRAQEVAARIGGHTHPFEDLHSALVKADIVIASTGARRPVLTRALIEAAQKKRRGRLLFLIDIAVPRDVEPEAAQLPNVFVADIDDLQRLADEHRDGRRTHADRAEAMVEQEVARFLEAYRGRRVGPTIVALRDRVLETARAEAERAVASLPGLGDREQRAMFELADAIAKKLLHRPQVALKKGGGDPVEGASLVTAAQRLFELDVPEEGGPSAPAEATDKDGQAAPAEDGRPAGQAVGR